MISKDSKYIVVWMKGKIIKFISIESLTVEYTIKLDFVPDMITLHDTFSDICLIYKYDIL